MSSNMRSYYNSLRGLKMGSRAKGRAVAAEATRRIRERNYAKKRLSVVPGYTRTGGAYGRPRGEIKYWDVVHSNYAIDTTPEVVTSLNLIPQGTTDQTRIGNKIRIVKIHFKGSITWSATNDIRFGEVRLVLVLDTQANGANPAWADIFDSSGQAVDQFRNIDNSERFKVLKEFKKRPVSFMYDTVNANVHATMTILKFNKKCDIPIHYSSTTGAITEVRSNNLVLLAVSNNGDDTHFLNGNWRIRYSDM